MSRAAAPSFKMGATSTSSPRRNSRKISEIIHYKELYFILKPISDYADFFT
jgi:hypothetical protein